MNQEFVRHPNITNYEASRDGVVRHRRPKIPVGVVNNAGYLAFKAGRKHLNHRFVYTVYNGEIPKGFVIDHIDGNKCNINITNLQAVTQSENSKRGITGACKMVGKRAVKPVNAQTGTLIIFQSMTSAGKYFGIIPRSVQLVADKVTNYAL